MRPIRVETRTAVVEAAIRVLGTNPGASMQDIASQAGVGRATLHRHYPSGADLMREVVLRCIRDIDDAVAPLEASSTSAVDYLHRLVDVIVPLGDRYHFLTREGIAFDDPEIASEIDRQARGMAELIDMVKAEGGIDAAVPTTWVVEAFDGLLYAAWSSVADETLTPKDAAHLMIRTLLRGLQGT